MDGYSYLHNIMLLNEISYNERSGRPLVNCEGSRLEVPVAGIIVPGIIKQITKILLEMLEGLDRFKQENPFLFHLSKIKDETPQSIKIRKIFMWAGIETTGGPSIEFIGLFQRPQNVPKPLEHLSGYTLTKNLAYINETRWKNFKLNCLAQDFFMSLRESPAEKCEQISRAFFVAASLPYGIAIFRIFKRFLMDFDKTTLLYFLIFKNGQSLSNIVDWDKNVRSLEDRKRIAELFAFSDEWVKLLLHRDPAASEQALSRFKDITHVDFEKRVIGCIKSEQSFIFHETFCASFAFGNYRGGEVVYRSFGKMNQPTLTIAQILYEEKWWSSLLEKKEEIIGKAQSFSHLFNEVSFSCMKMADERGFLARIDDNDTLRYSDKSKLVIYFLSFLTLEHQDLEPGFFINEHEDASALFDLSTLKNRCVLMGLWIRDVLKNNPSIDRKQFDFSISSGSILLKVMQEYGEDGRLLSEPVQKEVEYYGVLSPKTELADHEINQVFENYLNTLIYKEYIEIT